ncbi:MAG: tetratricopeptide repeat protein, partial [Phycisphaerales bacterium]|nr:tetratricopeptide repeat protein [Phycisphaerales bacterium]
LFMEGQLEPAKENFEQALAIFEQNLEPGEDRIWGVRSNLAQVLLELGQTEEGYTFLQAGYERVRNTKGASSREFADAAIDMADYYRRIGDLKQAYDRANEAVQAYSASLGRSQRSTATALIGRGVILRDGGDSVNAETDFREAWHALRKIGGEQDEDALKALDLLAISIAMQGRAEEAIELMRMYTENSEPVFGATYLPRIAALLNTGVLLGATGQREQAVESLQELLRLCSELPPGRRPEQCQKARMKLVEVYGELAESDPEGDWAERARLLNESP